jgi:predicted AAA+ superfamily ATPase
MINKLALNELIELLEKFPVVCIVGPRQIGKTTLAKEISGLLEKETVYLDLENPRDENKLSDPVLFFEANQDKCVIIDEVQRNKQIFPVLRSMVDRHRIAGRFILLGSASPELIRDSSESLAGRIFYKELNGLNLLEVNDTTLGETDLLIRGGFPNSLLARSIGASLRWREGFIQTYIEKDLPLLGLPLSPMESRKLLRMISYLQGQLLNYATLSNALGVSSPSVKRYLYFLQHAFLIDVLEPYSENLGKRLVKSPKIYLRDTGLLCALQGIYSYNDLLGHPMAGAIWEGFVIQQIKSVLPFDTQTNFYRTTHGAEIDLIITFPNQKKIGVEVKFNTSPALSRGNHEALGTLKLDMLYLITPGNENYPLKENIQVWGLHSFLTLLRKQEKERFD